MKSHRSKDEKKNQPSLMLDGPELTDQKFNKKNITQTFQRKNKTQVFLQLTDDFNLKPQKPYCCFVAFYKVFIVFVLLASYC